MKERHLWGDLSDESFRQERMVLERQFKALAPAPSPGHMLNLERAAVLLHDLPALWCHPGVTDQQQEALVNELLERAVLSGQKLVAIEPMSEYRPLFAYLAVNRWKNRMAESTRPDTFLPLLLLYKQRGVDSPLWCGGRRHSLQLSL